DKWTLVWYDLITVLCAISVPVEERARGYRRRALELGSNLCRFESRSGSAPLKRKCKDMAHGISLFLCFFAVRLIFPLPMLQVIVPFLAKLPFPSRKHHSS